LISKSAYWNSDSMKMAFVKDSSVVENFA